MPRIKTTSENRNTSVEKRGAKDNSNIAKLLEQSNKSLNDISAALKVQISAMSQQQKTLEEERKRQIKLEKEAEQRRKEDEARRKKAEKKAEKELDRRKKLEEKTKKQQQKTAQAKSVSKGTQSRGDTGKKDEVSFTKEAWEGVMPADRRQFAGSTMIGAAVGMDPALVQAFGLDKVGRAVWNKGKSVLKNTVAGLKGKKKEDKDSSKSDKGKAKEGAYGSVTQESTPITRRLDTIIKLLGGKPPKEKKGGEEKKDKSFLDTLFGKALSGLGKMLLPLLAAGLMSMLKPYIEKLLDKLLGSILGEELGGIASGIIADMLPGAIAGYTYSKMVTGKANWKAILIGGGISLAYYTIKRKVDEVMEILNGNPPEIKVEDYLDAAIRGAIIGATCVGFGKGSLKAAVLGAGIGVGVQWVVNRINDIQRMIDGEEVEIKEVNIGGVSIPESTFGAMISGALIGGRYGGFKGAIMGALIGGGLGTLWAAVVDFHNQMQAAKTGKYVEPKEICGIPYTIAAGLIGGAGIGMKFAGFWPGLFVGALIGGAAGWIMNEVQKYIGRTTASEANATKAMEENTDFQQIEEQKNADLDILRDPNATKEEKLAAQARIDSVHHLKEKTKAQLAGFDKWDKDNNGVLDEAEQKALESAWFKSGNSMDMKHVMQDMRAQGIEITEENLMHYNASKLQGQQAAYTNVIRNINGLPSVPMQTSSEMSMMQAQETQTKLADATEKLANLFEDAAEGDGFGNKTTFNVASGGSSSIDVYGSGSAAQSSIGG